LQNDLADCAFRVVIVQSREQAHSKVHDGRQQVDFDRCYANLLGLNGTVDPDGSLQSCCQYYQKTLGPVGSISSQSLRSVWFGDNRRNILNLEPRAHCINCSPSDEFVNRFVQFLKDAYGLDPHFLDWVEAEAFINHSAMVL
jgi:hypothetical protein